MRPIESDADLRRLHKTGVGLIYNDFSGRGSSGAKFNVLHAAHCSWILTSKATVRKFLFDTISEAIAWLSLNRGDEGSNWKRCGTCGALSSEGQRAAATDVPMPPLIELTLTPRNYQALCLDSCQMVDLSSKS